MIESGTVTKIKRGGNVVVSFDRKSACDQCRMCAVSKGGKTVEVILKNTSAPYLQRVRGRFQGITAFTRREYVY